MVKYVDDSKFPLVWIVYPERMSQEEMESVIGEMDEILDRDTPFVYVADLRSGFVPDARQREAYGAHYDRRRGQWRRLCRGGAAVNKPDAQREQRGMAVAISWKSRFPFPRAEFTDVREAEAWARAKLSG